MHKDRFAIGAEHIHVRRTINVRRNVVLHQNLEAAIGQRNAAGIEQFAADVRRAIDDRAGRRIADDRCRLASIRPKDSVIQRRAVRTGTFDGHIRRAVEPADAIRRAATHHDFEAAAFGEHLARGGIMPCDTGANDGLAVREERAGGMRHIGGDDQVARINNSGGGEENNGTLVTLALHADVGRANNLRGALAGASRTVGHSNFKAAAPDDVALGVDQAPDDAMAARREEDRLVRLRRGLGTPIPACGDRVITAIIGGRWLRKRNHRAPALRRLLARNRDVARTNNVDTVARTTRIDDHFPTTVARRQPRYLDRRTNDVRSRRKDASGWNGIRHCWRQRRITAIRGRHAVPNVRAPGAFAGGKDFGRTLIIITVCFLSIDRELSGEQEERH